MKPKLTISSQAAWAITGLSALMIGAGILLWGLAIVAAGRPVGLPSHQLTTPISGAVFAILGRLVLSRHPRHPIAWMLVGLGVVAGVESLNLGILVYMSLKAPGEIIPAPDLAHWLAQWIWSPRAFVPLTLLLLLFPDGQLPSRRWRSVAWAAVLAMLVSTVNNAISGGSWEGLGGVVRNPLNVRSDFLDTAGNLSGTVLLIVVLGSVMSVFSRFRSSSGMERQQLKWMAYAAGLVLVLIVLVGAQFAFVSDTRLATEIASSFVNLASVCIAVAASIAVLHYRLYDIDLIVNRTLVYGALSLLVVGLYVLIVGSVGAVFQVRGSLLVSLAATGVIAVLFQPMRDRLQRDVNRLLYGERDQPYDVLSRLGRRLEGPAVPEAMLASIVGTIAQTLKLPYVAIAFPNGGVYEIVSAFGNPTGVQIELPLAYKGGQVGVLICASRSPSESFTEPEKRLLRDIAVQAAVAVHASKLSAALQRSRERLVMAREEERRRLRRDLHDGLGPQLASLGFKLDAARNILKDDPLAADALLLQLRRQVKDAVGDIRRLTDNLRPPVLDELGLLPALRSTIGAQLSKTGLRIHVEGPDEMPPLPAAVEVAAYRIVQEAVTNVARHANAETCAVRLRVGEGLELEIFDDGIGLPESLESGVGLESMRERTAELGGRFSIEALPERGTKVVAQIPLVPK